MAMPMPSPYPNRGLEGLPVSELERILDASQRNGDRRTSDYVREVLAKKTPPETYSELLKRYTSVTQSPTMTYTWTDASAQSFQDLTYKPILKPTQKVGDILELTADHIKGDLKFNKGSVGRVAKVGTRYVYVEFQGMPGLIQFSPQDLNTFSKPSEVSFNTELDLSRVIMPDDHHHAIKEAVDQLKHNDKIFIDWGFDEVLEKGKAVSMLFYGPPGTGKTMCAEIIANTLGKKLKIIGTGEIQSSEPGQAERNIKAYFESKDDTLLLFDECDSLVHSRNSTGSIMAAQINALLTGLERFEGIVIFTTNRLGVLDEAFNRRLSLKLHFPMPTKEERIKIWQGMFPKKAPLGKDIKWDKLAELELTGGYIKNIVLRSARKAATQGLKTITYEVIKESAKHEVTSKREFEESARQHRRGGVTTINEAIQDFGQDNKLEVRNDKTRTSSRTRSNA